MNDIVYQNYTAEQLSAQMAVHATVENLAGFMAESAALAKAALNEVSGQFNIPYGEADIQTLDIFAPDGAHGAPVLIDIHGGGWTQGTKETRSLPAPAVNGRGAIWVPIDYGLAPNYNMSAIVDHVRQAVAWVHTNITDYGGDSDRVFVSGNSAGGHLAGTTVMPGWHSRYGIPENAVKGACAMSGVFDLEALVCAASGPNDWLKMDLQEANANAPIRHLPEVGFEPQFTPVMIVAYGEPELDEFKRQSRAFVSAWRGAGLTVAEIQVPGAHHFAMSRELANTDGVLYGAVMEMLGV